VLRPYGSASSGAGFDPTGFAFEVEDEGALVARISGGHEGAFVRGAFGGFDGLALGVGDGLSKVGVALEPVVEGAARDACGVAGGGAGGAPSDAFDDGFFLMLA
jgi:hypothetical protein